MCAWLEAGLHFVICGLQISIQAAIVSGFNVAALVYRSNRRRVTIAMSRVLVVIGSFSSPRYQRGGRIPAKYCINVVQSQHTHGCAGLYRGAPDVRQQERVLEFDVSRMKLRLSFKDVQTGRCYMTTLKSSDEIFIHDKSTPGGVDDDRPGRKKLDRRGIQKMMHFFRLRRIEAQKRADAKQIQRVGMEHRISHRLFR
jgi:hypothetical protein